MNAGADVDVAEDSRRLYTGEFPPGGPQDIDELVAALSDAVRRVRVKYGSVVDRLAGALDVDAADVMVTADSAYADWALAELGDVVPVPTREAYLPVDERGCPDCAGPWPIGTAHTCT